MAGSSYVDNEMVGGFDQFIVPLRDLRQAPSRVLVQVQEFAQLAPDDTQTETGVQCPATSRLVSGGLAPAAYDQRMIAVRPIPTTTRATRSRRLDRRDQQPFGRRQLPDGDRPRGLPKIAARSRAVACRGQASQELCDECRNASGHGHMGGAAIGLVAAILAVPAAAKPGDVIVGDADAEQVLQAEAERQHLADLRTTIASTAPTIRSSARTASSTWPTTTPLTTAGRRLLDQPEDGQDKVLAKGGPLVQPDGIALAPDGDLYVTDIDASALFRVAPPGGIRAGLGRRRPRRLGRRGRSA